VNTVLITKIHHILVVYLAAVGVGSLVTPVTQQQQGLVLSTVALLAELQRVYRGRRNFP